MVYPYDASPHALIQACDKAPTSPYKPRQPRQPPSTPSLGHHSTRLTTAHLGRSFPLQLPRLYLVLSILERTTPTTSTTAPPPLPNPHQSTNLEATREKIGRCRHSPFHFHSRISLGGLGGLLTALNQRRSRVTSGQTGQVTDAQLAVSGFYIRLSSSCNKCLVAALVLTSHWIGSYTLSTTAGLCLNILFHSLLSFSSLLPPSDWTLPYTSG